MVSTTKRTAMAAIMLVIVLQQRLTFGFTTTRVQQHAFISSFPRSFIQQQQRKHQKLHSKQIIQMPRRRHHVIASRLDALVPLSIEELSMVLSTASAHSGETNAFWSFSASKAPTPGQIQAYWGRTRKEQTQRWNQVALIMLFGTLSCYLCSFMMGSAAATLMGSFFLFYFIFGAQWEATQRNWDFLGGRPLLDYYGKKQKQRDYDEDEDDEDYNDYEEEEKDDFFSSLYPTSRVSGLYGALFMGHIADLCVVPDEDSRVEYEFSDFMDYTMETDELELAGHTGPYLLRVKVAESSSGRRLQIHARMSEEYLSLQIGQPVAAIVLSSERSFGKLAALSDLVVPHAQCWIGDYPYLDRAGMERLLADDVNDGMLWDMLMREQQSSNSTTTNIADDNHQDKDDNDPQNEYNGHGGIYNDYEDGYDDHEQENNDFFRRPLDPLDQDQIENIKASHQ